MSWHRFSPGQWAALAFASLTVAATPTLAAPHGHAGSRGGSPATHRGSSGSSYHSPYRAGYAPPAYVRPASGRPADNLGAPARSYYYHPRPFGFGLGASYFYPDIDFGYLAPVPDDLAGAPPPLLPPSRNAEPDGNDEVPPVPQEPLPATDHTARLRVRVPANAEVWIAGLKSRQTGMAREFISPPLTPGKGYVYTIRARWRTGQGPEDESREVRVSAGAAVSVDFTVRPPAEKVPALPRETDS